MKGTNKFMTMSFIKNNKISKNQEFAQYNFTLLYHLIINLEKTKNVLIKKQKN